MEELSIAALKREAICTSCIGESYLKKQVEAQGIQRICRYCSTEAVSITLEEMADFIETAFENHYSRTATDMDGFEWAMNKDPEIDYQWERKGEQTTYAISEAAQIEEFAADDIQKILDDKYNDFEAAQMGEETEFSKEAHYEKIMPNDREWRQNWYNFEQSLKSEARFFNHIAVTQLEAVFGDIGTMRTRSERPLIVEAGPNTVFSHLYRARAFQSDDKLVNALERPDRELAAPPSIVATSGRMNAKGISTFYGATDEATALAEVRPPVGSQVAVARFIIVRPLRLLDLNALSDVEETGSIFDPSYAWRLGRMMFLKSLCQRITRPVMPDDQDFEYLPTQAISDYLATEDKLSLDGILFPSVQAGGGGLNVVLFHKASRCTEIELAKGTKLSVSLSNRYDEEWEREYTVLEKVPSEVQPNPKPTPHVFDMDFSEPIDWNAQKNNDNRVPTLSIELDSIKINLIKNIKFESTAFSVKRHQIQQNSNLF